MKKIIAIVLAVFFLFTLAGCVTDEGNGLDVPGIDDIPGMDDEIPGVDDDIPGVDDDVPGLPDDGTEGVVATVNGEDVFSSEVLAVQNMYAQQGMELTEEQALEQLVSEMVLSQKASEEGFDSNIDDAEAMMSAQLAQMGMTLEDYKQELEAQGISYEDELNQLIKQISIQNYLNSIFEDEVFDVSEEEIAEYYEMYVEYYSTQEPDEEIPTLEELEPQIIFEIEQQKQQEAMEDFIRELVNEANVEYH